MNQIINSKSIFKKYITKYFRFLLIITSLNFATSVYGQSDETPSDLDIGPDPDITKVVSIPRKTTMNCFLKLNNGQSTDTTNVISKTKRHISLLSMMAVFKILSKNSTVFIDGFLAEMLTPQKSSQGYYTLEAVKSKGILLNIY